MTESLENCQLPQITDEETEAITTHGLAKFTETVAKPGLQPVSNSGRSTLLYIILPLSPLTRTLNFLH